MADDEDFVVAQLAVMCPDHDVALLSNVVHQIRVSGIAQGNNEILFNLCLDRVLFGPIEGVPPPVQANPIINIIDNNDEAAANNMKFNEVQPAVQFLYQSPMPGTSYKDRLAQVVDWVATTSRADTEPQSSSNNFQINQPIQQSDRYDIDPNKKVEACEVDRYVDHVKEMFPLVEKRWLNEQFTKGTCMALIVEQVVNRPGDVPKEKKPEKKIVESKKVSPIKKNYFKDFRDVKPDPIYIKSAQNLFNDEYKQVSSKSLTDVLKHFNYRYAPAARSLRNALANVDFRSLRGHFLPLNLPNLGAGDHQVNLHINQSRRPSRAHVILIPDDLKTEIAWLTEHFDEPDDSSMNVSVDFTSSPSSLVDLERQKMLLEAREKGELYECAICCDDLLIYEMVPCTDGHLFCTECLRNHAREIVFGQAKASVSCLEAECKAGFARETLQKALDEDWMIKLEERQFEEDVNCAEIENLIRCKYCNYAVVMDDSAELNKVFKCGNPECEREVCRLCGADWQEHIGLRCEELENSDETKLRRETEEKLAEAVIRRCHKCKAQMIKSDGCNKMTCRCGAKMCYICRKPDIDYNHFCNHLRTPGQATCEKCALCSLWEDPNKKDIIKIEEIKKTAETVQESLGTGQKRKIGVDDSKFTPAPATAVRLAGADPNLLRAPYPIVRAPNPYNMLPFFQQPQPRQPLLAPPAPPFVFNYPPPPAHPPF